MLVTLTTFWVVLGLTEVEEDRIRATRATKQDTLASPVPCPEWALQPSKKYKLTMLYVRPNMSVKSWEC